LSREDDDVGQREGWRITTTIAGGEVASSLSLRGVGKDLGERVAGGRPMMAREEHVFRFVVVVGLDPGSVKHPPSGVKGDAERHAGVLEGWTQQST